MSSKGGFEEASGSRMILAVSVWKGGGLVK